MQDWTTDLQFTRLTLYHWAIGAIWSRSKIRFQAMNGWWFASMKHQSNCDPCLSQDLMCNPNMQWFELINSTKIVNGQSSSLKKDSKKKTLYRKSRSKAPLQAMTRWWFAPTSNRTPIKLWHILESRLTCDPNRLWFEVWES